MNSNHGFKLDRFEVYNWGTFDEKVWVIEPKGFGALLTGENGSGKSTLVDGLLTLLVPNTKRNYNLASGSEKKERTELTYVRGAFGREQNELGNGQTKYLRKEEDYSVLLARFQNNLTRDSISLGEFFWFEQTTLHKLFFVSHSPISIHDHFSQVKNTKELRNRLKSIPQTTIFTTFTEYQAYFIKYVGLRSEKGLDLFNQITAIKEISRLNEFVRKHMLNANDAQDLLDSLYKNYQNLALSYQAIVLAKDQLEELNPLAEEAKKLKTLQAKLDQYQQERQAVPYFFARHKKEALTQQQVQLAQKTTENEGRLADTEFQLQSLNEQKSELMRLFSRDKTGQELERFALILNQYEEKRKTRQKQADHYTRLAKTLGLSPHPTLKEFSHTLENIKAVRATTETQLAEFRNQLYQKKKEQESFLKELETLVPEVQSLKTRKNRLPMALIQVREELVETLGISSKTLPFIAELIKVQDPEWEGAIEKLLHSFALRMLVPQDLYSQVNKFLNHKNIGLRLVFQKIDEKATYKYPAPNQIDDEKLFHKLEFHTKSPYIHWVKDQIIKHYDYACVDQLAIFQKQFKAITSQGLIKHGLSLNEKDDRFSTQDKSRFILGWDNQDKMDWILKEIQARQKSYDQTSQAVLAIEKSISRTEYELTSIRDLCQIDDYSNIDWQSIISEIDKIKKRQAVLMENDHQSGKIQKDRVKTEQDIRSLQDLRDSYLKEMAIATNSTRNLATEIDLCEKILDRTKGSSTPSSDWIESFIKKRKLKFSELNLRDYALLEKTTQDELGSLTHKSEVERQQLQVSLVRKMTHFKTRFSEHAMDLDTTLDSLAEYLELQKKLETDSLPEHERRFRRLLSKSVMNDMAAFKSTLDLAYEEIEETIQQLNLALRGIRYAPNSYVQLQSTRNKDVEVREFHTLLKHCLMDAQEEKPDQLEQCFERIKALLDRLKNEERWSRKVTDVRNWADFSVQERFHDTHEQKNFYSDSAGLSGGQKAKLAFTILASAIAYQYGLKLDSAQTLLFEVAPSKPSAQSNSFRFIVIDEAFSKSDEKNSQYAMELFQSLGLQVMVVTPKDKIHVVEPYVRSIFLTHMQEGQDRSQLISLSLERTAKTKGQNNSHAEPQLHQAEL